MGKPTEAYLEKFECHIETFQFPQQVHGALLNTQQSQNH